MRYPDGVVAPRLRGLLNLVGERSREKEERIAEATTTMNAGYDFTGVLIEASPASRLSRVGSPTTRTAGRVGAVKYFHNGLGCGPMRDVYEEYLNWQSAR
jgi:hypothetical protein